MNLIDTHMHLQDGDYDGDRAAVLDNMRAAGVCAAVVVGYDMPSSRTGLALSHTYKNLFCVPGIHPHDAKNATESDYAELLRMSADERVIGIGETGLDYHYDLSPRDVQRRVFVRHIGVAHEARLPLVVHIREAYEDALAVLSEARGLLNAGCLIHCFSGDLAVANKLVDAGFYLAFGGAITYKRNEREAAAVLRSIPRARALLETDAPYLSPEPYRGKRNEPAHVKIVAEAVARAWGTESEEVASVTTANALRLFGRLSA
ncbi:MAG: TatD family hydrolase [Clostridiales bacterium]|jgi:TatD DNase family protein|nr:TatD family hydrolase [Clostridiales bacterium]